MCGHTTSHPRVKTEKIFYTVLCFEVCFALWVQSSVSFQNWCKGEKRPPQEKGYTYGYIDEHYTYIFYSLFSDCQVSPGLCPDMLLIPRDVSQLKATGDTDDG